MDKKQIAKDLESRLSRKRYVHSMGVSNAARHLARLYGADPDKAELAGLVHDCAKDLSLEEMQHLAEEGDFDCDDYMFHSRALLHGPAGSVLARRIYNINDQDILSAIYYHTTGNPNMTLLEKIIFLADYIEPSRDFPGVEEIRQASERSLDEAMICAYRSTISHLLDQEAYIYPLTLAGWNALILEHGEKK